MSEVLNMFREGGVGMYVILAGSLPAWLFAFAAVIATLFKRNSTALMVTGGLALLTGLFPLIAAVAFYIHGLDQMERALELASPEHRDIMRAAGERVAVYPLYFGFALGSVPTLIGSVATAFGYTSRPRL